ncbi:LytR/AlgR family response regulator transcription factor [Streptococcus marmotae]|uniref:LytR/AlgR family response regulator transcription factor n=1 Tax=Streptococcus marmotae TaxID=1825069 RepID=UPI0008308AA9|nr:LytTR family DNA-binding domain-containing protein [Streptococcus marmotae]
MIRIAIVEDDDGYAQTLIDFLQRYEREQDTQFKWTRYKDGEEIVLNYPDNVDIILMDIEMDRMDGMTAAEKIRVRDRDVVIIFITNMMHYAMKGYAVEALDYVLKPINYFAFAQRITRALERMTKKQGKQLLISRYNNVKRISTDELAYVEVHNHEIEYHLVEEVISVRGTLKALEKELEGLPFFRCNSGCIINLDYVDGLEDNDVLVGENRIPVSRARRKEFLDRMNHYLNEVGK